MNYTETEKVWCTYKCSRSAKKQGSFTTETCTVPSINAAKQPSLVAPFRLGHKFLYSSMSLGLALEEQRGSDKICFVSPGRIFFIGFEKTLFVRRCRPSNYRGSIANRGDAQTIADNGPSIVERQPSPSCIYPGRYPSLSIPPYPHGCSSLIKRTKSYS